MADLSSLLGSAGVGGAIGKAIVSLELDTKKYLGEMQAAEGQTVASTNAMGSSTSKFAGLAKSAMLGAGVAAVAFAAISVKAAIEANDAHLKLQNTFENNAKLADSSVEAFEAQADSLRDLTGVDDEAIISSQALLGQFDLTGQQVMDLIPLIVDLSEKMGIDLEAATKAVGKATAGNTGGLARYGIVLDKTKVSTDAYAATVEGLGVVQGFAAKSADAEPWRVLGEKFEEIEEQLGQDLLPVLQDLAQTLIDAMPTIEKFVGLLEKIPKVSPGIIQGAAALGRLSSTAAETFPELAAVAEKTVAWGQELGSRVSPAVLQFASFLFGAASAQEELADKTDEATDSLRDQLDAVLALTDPTFALIHAVRDNRDAERELAQAHERVNRLQREGKTDTKGYAEAQRDLREKALAAAESQGDLSTAVRRLQQEIADGKTSRHEAIEAIRTLGKEAGLSGKDLKGLADDVRGGLTDAAATARRLAPGVGRAISQGMAGGVREAAADVALEAAQAVRNALAAARAAAGAKSPSKEMHKLGVDMMVGLANGISKTEQKAIDAARTSIEKLIDQVGSELDKIKGKAQSFSDSIRSGFSGFLDLTSGFAPNDQGVLPDIGTILQSKFSGASALAATLQALKTQGAGKALLQQVATGGAEGLAFGRAALQGGPQQIQEINDTLKTIADLAQLTGKGLSEDFFGRKIDKIEAKLDRLHDDLRELNGYERRGHSHDINIDGKKLASAIRDDLIRTGSQNADIFGGKA